MPLFDRIGRRVQLTSEGEDLLGRSRRLLADAESLGERARTLKTGQTGILRIGATPQVIEKLLADSLAGYGRRHPGVEIHLVEDGGVRLPGRLERGDVHLALASADERFQFRLLYPMHVLAVLSPERRMGRRATLEISELADEPLLLLRRDLDRASGSTPPARPRTSGRACSWKARPPTRSWRWLRPTTGSQSFPRTHT